jgi:2-isopropylmalate synthase
MRKIQLYDTTLRDGCQSEDVSLTLDDKLRVAELLDDLGIHVVEGGWPGSNPRDEEFFRAVKKLRLRHARIAAFGTTKRPGVRASEDRNLQLCVRADTPVVTIVGKTWDLHVKEDLRIALKANLEVIAESVAYLKKHTDEVVFDAEHFFDGYAANPEYALACLAAAAEAGAGVLCLCDTRRSTRRRRPSREPLSASTATTTASWRSRTRWPRSSTAARRCRARSTASASAVATRTSSRSSRRCS